MKKRDHRLLARYMAPLFALVLSGCGRLDTIDYSPKITPEEFLRFQPHVHMQFGGLDFVLIQPSSTAFVYCVALLTLGAGFYFLRMRNGQRTRIWWGIGLLFSGIGAFLAGTSYQAFGYEIKCAGRQFCTWTSWWEVAYLILTAAGMNAMLVAVAHSCAIGAFRKGVCAYAALNASVYAGVVLLGALVPIRFLVSFECLMLVSTPAVLLALIVTARAYQERRDAASLALLRVWGGFIVVIGTYVLFLTTGISRGLWSHGVWFTENDVLHIGMILWVLYVTVVLPKRVEDARNPGPQA